MDTQEKAKLQIKLIEWIWENPSALEGSVAEGKTIEGAALMMCKNIEQSQWPKSLNIPSLSAGADYPKYDSARLHVLPKEPPNDAVTAMSREVNYAIAGGRTVEDGVKLGWAPMLHAARMTPNA